MIRIGTIGTSSITTRTVAAARAVPDVRVTAAYGRDAARAAALASDLDIPRSTDDLAALLASPDVDAVYVASPNAIHAGQIRQALDAGKHVLTEKPAVQTASEWDDLCALATARSLVLLENMRTAYDPVFDRIVELLPSLGRLRRVSFALSQLSSRYADLLAGRVTNIFDPALGGGALSDIGVYLTHPLARLLGTPARVHASVVKVSTGADGAGAALLDYEGTIAELAWSKITYGRFGGSIEGEAGTITIDHLTELYGIDVDYASGERLSERPTKEADNITYTVRRFAELVAGGGSPAVDQSWTRGSLALMDAIRAAAA